MRRIIDEVGRWACFLNRTGRGLPMAGEDDGRELRFGDELFGLLHEGENERLAQSEQDPRWCTWAAQLHEAASKLPAFARLADTCRGDADAAAIAVDALLEELSPNFTDGQIDPVALRRALKGGTERAAGAVDELQEAVLGLGHVAMGGQGGGAGTPSATGVVGLARRLRDHPALRRVAVMAGKFRRVMEGKRRSRVAQGAGELGDVVRGGDVGRLLPCNLVGLRHPALRLQTLAAIVEKKALVYELRDREEQGRGPLVLLLDRSSSMNEGGRDVWARASALALLALAKQDRRVFALVGFTEVIAHEVVVGVHDKLPEAVLEWPAEGGTNISLAVGRGLDIVERGGALGRADLVLVTDGHSDVAGAAELKERAVKMDVSILGLGIGVSAADLRPWCDSVQVVGLLDHLDDSVAGALAQVGQ